MIPVSAVEYVNVRIRAFHSRLFDRDTYEDLMGSDNLGAVTTFLLDNPFYRGDVERALSRLPEREGLERGCISDVFRMADGRMKELFKIAVSSFDLKNMKVLVTAQRRGIPFRGIRDMLVPCGVLNVETLSRIYDAGDFEEIIRLLPACCPLASSSMLESITDMDESVPVVVLLNRLEHHLYRRVLEVLDVSDGDEMTLREIFRYEIDLKNITSALKRVWERTSRASGEGETFIKGGSLGEKFLDEMSRVDKLEEALEMIEETHFHGAVEKGIIYYAETGFFHEMERFLEEVLIIKAQSYRRFQPFGIGPFIAYLWAHFAEMTNMRTIINGIAFKAGPGQIRKGLLYV